MYPINLLNEMPGSGLVRANIADVNVFVDLNRRNVNWKTKLRTTALQIGNRRKSKMWVSRNDVHATSIIFAVYISKKRSHKCYTELFFVQLPGAGFMNRRRLCQLTAAILTSDLTTRTRVLWSDTATIVWLYRRRVDPIRWTRAWRWRNGKFDCLLITR